MSTGKIRAINNAFRMIMTGGTVLLTAGVDTLPSGLQAMVIRCVATFSDFNEDNDPRGKHAFGSFILAGRKFFFKLDCYDLNMEFGSENPTTHRRPPAS